MKTKILVFLLSSFFSVLISAQIPTWAKDIAPILYKNCSNCHRQGSIAPFSLKTYDDAYFRAASIQHSVEDKHMPPFPPNTKYQHYANERILSDADIKKISDWAKNGAPEGNPADAPAFPTAPPNSLLGQPDLVLKLPQYTIAETQDVYRCFVVPTTLTNGRYLSGIEVIPGNREVVHHVLIYQDSTGKSLALDNADPKPGYVSFGGPGFNPAELIAGWVPGTTPWLLPKDFGIRIAPKGYIVVQVHYPTGSTGKTDSTKLNLFFNKKQNGIRQVTMAPVLEHTTTLVNGPLIIPANQVKTFQSKFTNLVDASVFTVGPHMHMVGTKVKSYGILPNKDTLKFIDIPKWDFHWQGFYPFKKVIKVPKGTTLYADAVYDNTTNNPSNPNTPPKLVKLGEATTDEMMLVYFTFCAYQPGDENISLENTVGDSDALSLQGYDLVIAPNPVRDRVSIMVESPENQVINLILYNIEGKLQEMLVTEKTILQGKEYFDFNVNSLSSGIYFLQLRTSDGRVLTKKLVKE